MREGPAQHKGDAVAPIESLADNVAATTAAGGVRDVLEDDCDSISAAAISVAPSSFFLFVFFWNAHKRDKRPGRPRDPTTRTAAGGPRQSTQRHNDNPPPTTGQEPHIPTPTPTGDHTTQSSTQGQTEPQVTPDSSTVQPLFGATRQHGPRPNIPSPRQIQKCVKGARGLSQHTHALLSGIYGTHVRTRLWRTRRCSVQLSPPSPPSIPPGTAA